MKSQMKNLRKTVQSFREEKQRSSLASKSCLEDFDQDFDMFEDVG